MTDDSAIGASASVTGKQDRAAVDVAERLEGRPRKQEKRCRVDTLRLAFVADKDLVKERAK